MTELLVLSSGIACLLLSRGAALASANGALPVASAPAGWTRLLAAELGLLQPWLAVGPVCWALAFGLVDDPALHDLALALGVLPVLGALAAFGAALVRVGLELAGRCDDEDPAPVAPFVLATAAALSVGAAVGMGWRTASLLVG